MTRPPRAPGTPILQRRYLGHVSFVSLLIAGATLLTFQIARNQGLPLDQAQTWAVTLLALGQSAYLLNSRYLRESSLRPQLLTTNRVVWLCIGSMLLLQVLFVYAPFMHAAFHSAAIGADGWLIPLALSVAIFFLVEAGKAVQRRRQQDWERPAPGYPGPAERGR